MTNKRIKIIISALILAVIAFSLCIFPTFAAVNVDYEFNISDGYVYITVSPQQTNYKFMLASNYSIFTVNYDALSWQWILQTDSSGSVDQSNAFYWALFPFTTRQIDSRTLQFDGIDLSELKNYDAEIKVTYKFEGRGIKYIDDFIPIEIFEITPGRLSVSDIKDNVSNQTLSNTSKLKKRQTSYYYDEIEDWATVSYTVLSSDFEKLNDMIFVKHNASIEYLEDTTLAIITDLQIKLNYSDAQKILNMQNVTNSLLSQIFNALFDHRDEIEQLTDAKVNELENAIENAKAPDIEFETPDYSFIEYETSDFSGSDFMDVITSCPGYMILLTLGTSLWICKLILFGKG